MPAWLSSSGHGCWPGEPGVRSCSWQAFDGAPTLTYRLPESSMANAFDAWLRCCGKALDHRSPARSAAPAPRLRAADSERSRRRSRRTESRRGSRCRCRRARRSTRPGRRCRRRPRRATPRRPVRLGLAQGDEDVAIIAHRDVARPPDTLGEHLGVETLGHSDTGVLVDRACSPSANWSAWPNAGPMPKANGQRMRLAQRLLLRTPPDIPCAAARPECRLSDHDPPTAR